MFRYDIDHFGDKGLCMTSTIQRRAIDGRGVKGDYTIETRIESVDEHMRRITGVLAVSRRQLRCYPVGFTGRSSALPVTARKKSAQIAGISSMHGAGTRLHGATIVGPHQQSRPPPTHVYA
jgi:hypothetical protein